MPSKPFSHKDYSVGWICALPKELAAANAMLDKEHEPLSQPDRDNNAYTLGSIGSHNVVIACLPGGEIGNNAAANIVTQMINTFPCIKFGLMVGIGGGIPSRVRLGDIVVSKPSGLYPGVVQWDLGKSEKSGFKRIGALDRPPKVLLTALAKLQAHHDMHDSKIHMYLQEMVGKYPKLAGKYTWSPRLKDPIPEQGKPRNSSILYASIFAIIIEALVALLKLLLGRQEPVQRDMPSMSDTNSSVGEPRSINIHYGLIVSGNQVVKNAIIRDRINKSLDDEVLCIEMEAAGLMNNFPCIIIRGICDYADAQKNKEWQEYAAALAAGYTKELLQHVRPADVDSELPVKDILHKVEETVLRIEQAVNKDEVRRMLDWLTTINYGQQQDMHSAVRKQGTGQWIFETDEFQSWLNNSKQKLLCRGMPGAGKTIIASVVIDYLVDISRNDSEVGVAYVYCNFKQPKGEQTIHSLLSSILRQLASGRQIFPTTTRGLYEQHSAKQTHASQEQLITDLKAVIELHSSVFVIIDALDECDLEAMGGFISELFILQEHCNMSIFATSRFIPEITEWFAGADSSFLEIRALASDIATYLDVEMKQSSTNLIKSNPGLQDDIKREIAQAADGMFLLAQLYFQLLRDKINAKEVRKELQTFRADARGKTDDEKRQVLTHAYDTVIERINEQSSQMRNLAMKVLLWVTFSKRALNTFELQHALATNGEMETLDDDDLSDLGDIGRVCVGLVTVDEKSGLIQLVHYTAQEYFENTQPRWFPEADSILLGACIAYLSFQDFDSGFCRSDTEFEERQARFPFGNYAASHWGNHIAKNEKPGKKLLEFLNSSSKVEASIQAQLAVKQYSSHAGYSQEVPRSVTALHLVAQFGLTEVARVLLEDRSRHEPNSRDSDDQTPLLWATRNGHEDVTGLLIDVQANLEVRDREQGATPLIWAARNGYESIVHLLLQKGSDVNAEDNTKRTPLSVATLYKHNSIIQLLLENHGIINASDEADKIKLLQLVTWIERPEIIKLLFHDNSNDFLTRRENGTDIGGSYTPEFSSEAVTQQLPKDFGSLDEFDEDSQTLFLRAAERGDEKMVQILMATGKIDINVRDRGYQETPLIWAARKGHEAVVKLLLNAGADVNVSEKNSGETALTLAIEGGNVSIIQALLDKGANVHHRDHTHHTPLFTTTWQDNEAVMKLLLERGADVNARNIDGQTPIFNTCVFGNVQFVKMLLEAGADINAVDIEGRTPLFFAAALGQRDVASLLLERGIDINARDKEGRTALYAAVGSGNKTVVTLLLDTNKMDVYNQDEQGTTPIDWAKEKGDKGASQVE
ncbi:ankyrin repeat-containing domain protein [Trichoderma chlorosporum]